MKGLLLKEFYQWLKTRSFFTVASALLFAVFIFIPEEGTKTIPTSLFGVVFGLAINSFILDDKSGWNEYSKSLPCSPFQRVTAKYIFFAPELMLFCLAEILFALIPQKISDDFYMSLSPLNGYPEAIISFALWMICISITLPLCIHTKGNKKYFLAILPLFLTMIASTFASLKLRTSLTPKWISQVTANNWFYPAVVIASVCILVASWLISIAIEGRGDKKYSLKFLKIALIPIMIAVALSGAIGNVIYTNRDFIEEKQMKDSNGYKYIYDIDEITEEYNEYYSSYSGRFSLGMTVTECADNLKKIGYIQNVYSPQKFSSESGKINVNLTTDEESGKVISIFAYCNQAEKVINNATDEDFEEITSNFTSGMTETELLEKFEELKLLPCDIQEWYSGENQPSRIYNLRFSTPHHNRKLSSSATFKITITTDGKTVTEISPRLFKLYEGEKDDTVTPYSEETPLEVANYEIKAFISAFCNERHLEETPRECVKKLKAIDYSESEETDNLFYSPNRKVSVTVAVKDKEKIEKITSIVNYGELRYIESSTDKEMDELIANFVLGMTENDFQQKLQELDALPEKIIETTTEKNEHLRSYEIRYRIGNFNSDGAVTYTVTVDITDGKLTNVDVYCA